MLRAVFTIDFPRLSAAALTAAPVNYVYAIGPLGFSAAPGLENHTREGQGQGRAGEGRVGPGRVAVVSRCLRQQPGRAAGAAAALAFVLPLLADTALRVSCALQPGFTPMEPTTCS